MLLTLALGALCATVAGSPPGGASWSLFFAEPIGWPQKARYLADGYLWPGLLSLCAIILFQLQIRLSSSGANKRVVFSVCLLASGAMLLGLRAVSFSPNTGPSYAAGMALGYMTMSRLYAVRMGSFAGKIRVPWPVWRGNAQAVQEIDQMARMRMASR